MTNEHYVVTIGKTPAVFEFISEGKLGKIPKLIIYSETDLHNFYNLGFGDKNQETGEIDDIVVSNNGDADKVLMTVASTLYSFTDTHPDAMIFATGSTKARTRLYRMGISRYLKEIEVDFQILGLSQDGEWYAFEKNTTYEAFLAIRKNHNFNP